MCYFLSLYVKLPQIMSFFIILFCIVFYAICVNFSFIWIMLHYFGYDMNQDPRTKIQDLSTMIQDSSTKIQAPSTMIQDPSTKIQDPSTKDYDPSTKYQDPKKFINKINWQITSHIRQLLLIFILILKI